MSEPATPLDYFHAHPEVTAGFDADDWDFAEIMRWRDLEAEPAAPPRLTEEWFARVDLDARARVDANLARSYAENTRHMAERAALLEQSESEYEAHHVAQFGCSQWAPADVQRAASQRVAAKWASTVADIVGTWSPLNLDSVLDGTHVQPEPELLTRTDGKSLLYPALVHSIHGESESGKSWVSQYAVAHCLRLDQDVLVIDNESDAASYAQRLILLRVTREQIRAHLSYVRPESSPNTSAVELAAFERMLDQSYRLAVIDGVTDSMSLFGLSIKDNDEVARWMRSLPRRIADQTGAAVVLIDHVVKSSDNQGRFAIGAQAKMAGLSGAAYVVEVVEALGVGRKGELALRVGKDRPGAVRGFAGEWRKSDRTQAVARFVLDSSVDPVVAALMPPVETPSHETQVASRMQGLRTKIVACVAVSDRISKNGIDRNVPGRKVEILEQVDWLVEQAYLGETKTARGGEYRVLRPYGIDPFEVVS